MTDAVWTAEATEKAVALWIEGRDPAEIAGAIGTTVAEVIGRVAQAALARQQAQAAAEETGDETAKALRTAAPAETAVAAAPVARVEPAMVEPVKAQPGPAEPAKAPAPRILPSKILPSTLQAAAPAPAKVAPAKPVLAKPVLAKPVLAKPVLAKPAPTKPAPAQPAVAPQPRAAAPQPAAPRAEAPVMSARALEEATRAFLAANQAPARKAPPVAVKAAPAVRPPVAVQAEAPRVQAPLPRAVEAPVHPVAPVVQPVAAAVASAPGEAAEAVEGGSVVALPMSRRVPAAAADGGEGVLFLKAGLLDCTFPLWADGDGTAIESKRVCGCRVLTGKRWCRTHYATVFEPPKRPMRAA